MKINPFENPSKKLAGKNIGKYKEYVRSKVKNKELAETIVDIITMCQHSAFELGKMQGRYEISRILNNIMHVENPEIENPEIEK